MKEETLKKIKEEVEELRKKNEEINKKNERILELESDSRVKEYLRLRGIRKLKLASPLKEDVKSLVNKVYYRYTYSINEEDTNKIYVYLGTYKDSLDSDIVHGSNRMKVHYNDPKSEYRIFQDIELDSQIILPISKCEEFERTHKIIYIEGYSLWAKFYQMQIEFFTNAVIYGEKEACKLLLRKYNSK